MFSFLKGFYRNHIGNSFIAKSVLIYSTVSIIPILVLSLIITNSISKVLIQKEDRQNSLLVYNLNNYMDQKYDLVYKIVRQAYTDIVTTPEVFYFLENEIDESSIEYLEYKQKFNSYFYMFFGADEDLRNAVIYKKRNQSVYLISKDYDTTFTKNEIDMSDFNKHMLLQPPTVKIFPTHIPDYNVKNKVYSFSINIKRLGTNANLGVLKLDFSPDGLSSAIKKMNNGKYPGNIYVLTDTGDVIYDSSNLYYGLKFPYFNEVKKSPAKLAINSENCMLHVSSQNDPGLMIISAVPEKIVLGEVNTIKRTVFLLALLCMAAAAVFIRLSTSYFANRIKAITSTMQRVRSGDLSARVNILKPEDEIGDISTNFNRMCDDLKNYIDKVYISEIKQKSAEINALQAQINPHFLYNTLEAIRMTAVTHGDKEVGKMIYILANLFRSIIREETIVMVESELNYTLSYLELFKIRYEDRLSYNIDADESVMGLGIIKHLIQPVVENYIFHGYDIKKENNTINIHCSRRDDFLIIRIADNGLGINEEGLKSIRASLTEPHTENRKNIGLQNVNDRIRLVYGPKYGIKIESTEGNGTTVTIQVAAVSQKELLDNVQSIDRR